MITARILIVEDERIVAKHLEQRLTKLGYVVTAAVPSAAEAIQKADETRPDLVLMDIQLEGQMDGIEAAARIRARFNIPVIYLTAYAEESTVLRARSTEPFGYLLKPFEVRELHATIQVALYRKALEQQRADFLAMLTHDIKNPLGVILGYAEMLLEGARARGAAEDEHMLGKLQSSTLTVHSLVTNYLDLVRIEAGHQTLASESLVLNSILDKVGRQYANEARLRRLDLQVRLQEPLPVITGNLLALERVFANLVHNALKFTPEGGRVTISSAWQNGTVVAAIADTGPGIPPEEIPLLFEKYQRHERDKYRAGTGLGLFIVKSLVEAHGGRIEVESEPGAGTCFSMFLPLATAEVAAV